MAKQHNPQTPPPPAPLSSPDGSRCARDGRSGTLGCPYLPSSSTGRRRARRSRPQPAGRAAPPWAPGHSGLTRGGWRQGKRSGAVCFPPRRLPLCSCSPLPTVGRATKQGPQPGAPLGSLLLRHPPKKTPPECPHEPPAVKTPRLRAPHPPRGAHGSPRGSGVGAVGRGEELGGGVGEPGRGGGCGVCRHSSYGRVRGGPGASWGPPRPPSRR